MKILSRIFDFYLDASVHVALAVFCLIKITVIFLDIETHNHLAFYVFFGTIACYNFVKYGVEAEKYILLANRYHRNIQFFSFLALAIALYHAIYLNLPTWIGIGILLFLIGLYSLPIFPGLKRFRSIGLLKIILVGLVWAGSTVVLPVIITNTTFSWDVSIETLQRVILVVILLIPFEVRDLKYDQPDLKTLPQRYGIANSKIFGAFAAVFFFFLTLSKDHITSQELISKGLLFLFLGILMFVTKREQSKYFASFWVEAIPIVWYGIVLLLEYSV